MNHYEERKSHNPYFNRWFSAIKVKAHVEPLLNCHNPYFNRWFSAMLVPIDKEHCLVRHNPYFNRWFSAIELKGKKLIVSGRVTILILIDGFLQ